jgi:holo-[acyl-carrier protein] synthase
MAQDVFGRAFMPVVGIGIDVVEVRRLKKSLERFGKRMEDRLFTTGEMEYCRGHKDPLPHLAARFAAKEAASKALGTGMGGGVAFRLIEVLQPGGQVPRLLWHGAALDRYRSMGCTESHLSLTHDAGMAIACVVLER